MATYHPYMMEYKRFMTSFKMIYPELYEKYNKTINIPVNGCGRVSVNNKITSPAKEIIDCIINEYYIPLNN